MRSLIAYIKSFFTDLQEVKPLDGLSGLELSEAISHNLVVEGKVPGMAITITKQGKTLLQKGFGYANREHKIVVDPRETIFRIASISKCLTGLALGKMVEEGIVGFDDSLYKHVPYFPKKEYDFTLRQLASHTAGIRAYRGKEFALNRPYTLKESLTVFENDKLLFEPGKGYLYNSFDFVLLALAMQEASGVSFEDYVKTKILRPLGMNTTFTPLRDKANTDRAAENQAVFYTKTTTGFKKAIEVNNFYKLGGGGYLSTSENIDKLGQELLYQKLLKKETYQELLTAQMVNGTSTYYGLGFQVSKDKHGHSFVGHVGSSVGAYSNLFVYPEKEVVVAILVNCTDPIVQESLDTIVSSCLTVI